MSYTTCYTCKYCDMQLKKRGLRSQTYSCKKGASYMKKVDGVPQPKSDGCYQREL